MKGLRQFLLRVQRAVQEHRLAVWSGLIGLVWLLTIIALVQMAARPDRYASDEVALDSIGLPGITLQITHPTRLSPDTDRTNPRLMTIRARAEDSDSVVPLLLALPIPDRSLAFVDRAGNHVPDEIEITPGHPAAIPYDLWLSHEGAQVRGGPGTPHTIRIVPVIQHEGLQAQLPELAISIRLESSGRRALREMATALIRYLTPAFALALLIAATGVLLGRFQRSRLAEREAKLAERYRQLSEHVRLEQWRAARACLDDIRLERPSYRDVERIDAIVSAAETAAWRRSQLYRTGVEAYRERDWPTAVNAFHTIEQETPYYRDVAFLRRTASLYADLRSRDRSRRIAAAAALGKIADLIDYGPLVEALGDRSDAVSQAAKEAFAEIGVQAFDALISALAHRSPAVVGGAYDLLRDMGHDVREDLLTALRSADPRITRPVASLLARLGAREELAQALLWSEPEHHEGIVVALQHEGIASTGALVTALCEAPPGRRQTVVNALAALKTSADIGRRLEEAARSTRSPKERMLIQRAVEAPPSPFVGAAPAGPSPVPAELEAPNEQPRVIAESE